MKINYWYNTALLLFFTFFFFLLYPGLVDSTASESYTLLYKSVTTIILFNFGLCILDIVNLYHNYKFRKISKSTVWIKTGISFCLLFLSVIYFPQTMPLIFISGLASVFNSGIIIFLYKIQPERRDSFDFNNIQFFENPVFNELWQTKQEYITVRGRKLKYYTDPSWRYKNEEGTYETKIAICEGNILIETAKGEVQPKDAIEGLKLIKNLIITAGLGIHDYYYIADSRQITNASLNTRKIVIDFHEQNKNLKQFILITNHFTKVLIKLMTPINPEVVNNWLTSDSVENSIYVLFKHKHSLEGIENKSKSFIEQRIDQVYQMISDISLRKFGNEKPVVPESDPFYDIFTSLEILKNDKKELIHELNELLKESHKSLENQERKYKLFFENTYEIILVTDSNNILLDYNQGASEFWENRGIELKVGYNLSDFLKEPEEVQLLIKNNNPPIIDKIMESEFELNDYKGGTISLLCKYHVLKDAEEKLYQVFMMNDITLHKQLLIEKNRLNEKILNQSIRLTEFSNLLSQDLRKQAVEMVNILDSLKHSLNYTSVNLNKVSELRKALDGMEKVMKDLDGVLNVESKEVTGGSSSPTE
ncbi:MAG: PAS domain S-box protein [Cytophagaceae bacterium]